MGFQIEVKTGDAGPVVLRGCSDGTVEFCKWVEQKQRDGSFLTVLVPYKFYASIEQAFDRVLRMRVASFNAKNIKDLVIGIKQIRADIKAEMGILL